MRRCYFLAAMMMVALGLQAQREKPVPVGTTELQPSQDTGGQMYYLYSKAGDFFYTSGNNWGTQASQGTEGHPVYFRPYLDADQTEWDGQRYVIRNWISDSKGWNDIFIIDNYLVNDCSDRGNNVWSAEWKGDEVRFYAAKFATSGFDEGTFGSKVYFGIKPDDGTTTLWPTGVVPEAVPVDWTLVKNADYENWLVERKLYALAETLKADIDATQEAYPDIDLSKVEAIYNDATSTEDALNGAKEEIKAVIKAYLANKAGTTEPIDATLLIANPDYAKSNNNAGWQGTALTVSDGCAEVYNKPEYDSYQKIGGLPKGIYKLNLHGLFRVAHPTNKEYYSADGVNLQPRSRVGYLYGASGDVTSKALMMDILEGASSTQLHSTDREYAKGKWCPDRRAGFTVYNNEDLYSENTLYVPVTDDTLRIGVQAEKIAPSEAWCVFNNWSLSYCGTTFAAYDAWRTDFLQKMTLADDALAQATLLTPFRAAEEAANNATTAEQVLEQYQKMYVLYPQVCLSADAYEAYQKAAEAVRAALEAKPMASSEPLELLEDYLNEFVEPGETYVHGTYQYIIENCPLNEEELLAEQTYMDSLLTRARKLDVKEGTDITDLLQNPDMKKKNFEGWTRTADITDNFNSGMGEDAFPVGQAFKTKFDLSQKVSDIPDGLYKLELNGLFRFPDADEDKTDEAPVVLYINDFESPVKNIHADAQPEATAEDSVNCFITNVGTWPYDNIGEKGYVPNSVNGCSFAFRAGRYKQTVYGLVTGGEMTIGLKDPREAKNALGWTVFSNFKLTYMAKNMDAMEEVLDSLKSRVLTMDAKMQYCSKDARDNAVQIIEKGKAATDVEEKYEILKQANEYMKVLAASAQVYAELSSVLDYVFDAYWAAVDKAGTLLPGTSDINDPNNWTPEYKAAVEFETGLFATIGDNMRNGAYSNDEATALIKQLRLTPIVDVIYVVGDLKDASTWNVNSGLYPLTRQADGTYQGTFTGLDRHGDGGYGNRDMVFFSYQGKLLDGASEHPRWVASGRNEVELREVPAAANYMAVYGGTWKVTINADRTKATFEPVGEELLPDYCYIVGNLKGDSWTISRNHPLVHMGHGKYYGEIEIDEEGNHDITLFAGGWAMYNSNWTEGRVGTAVEADTIQADRYGQVIAGCDRFYGEPRWILEPGHYQVEFDALAMTVKFTKVEDVVEHAGTAEDPFHVASLFDMVYLHQRIQPGRVNYVVMDNDIDMSTITNWTPLNLAENVVGDKAYMNWIDFDGKNHVIYNLRSQGGWYSGMFGVLCGGVRNVGFSDVDVDCTTSGSGVLAGYAGHSNFKVDGVQQTTTFENVWVEGKLHVGSGYCGGLIGNVGGPTTMKNCFANVAISVDNAETVTGGIAGRISSDFSMENVYAAGSVTGTAVTTGVIGAVKSSYTGHSIYKNVCVWNNSEQIFGAGKTEDVMEGILYYDGTNFSDLQKAVVAWDPEVWSCTMEEGSYPVLKNIIGTGIGSVNAGTDQLRTDGTIYNLSGQRVEKMQKGIYILNGRKVLVK